MVTHTCCPLCPGTWSCLRRVAVIPGMPGRRDLGQAVNNQVCGCRSRGLHCRPAGKGSRLWEQVARRGYGSGLVSAAAFKPPPAWFPPETPTQHSARPRLQTCARNTSDTKNQGLLAVVIGMQYPLEVPLLKSQDLLLPPRMEFYSICIDHGEMSHPLADRSSQQGGSVGWKAFVSTVIWGTLSRSCGYAHEVVGGRL